MINEANGAVAAAMAEIDLILAQAAQSMSGGDYRDFLEAIGLEAASQQVALETDPEEAETIRA